LRLPIVRATCWFFASLASPAVMGIALPSLRSEVNLLDLVRNVPCR